MEIKKTNLYLGVGLLVLVIGLIVGVSAFKPTGNAVSGDVQKVVIGMNNWVYSPSYIKVKAGVPVEISLDNSVQGCFRDLIIPELRINKYLATSKDKIRVTFEKGEYTFACSMFMGQGKIVAE